MGLSIRKIKNSAGNTSVQVVSRPKRKTKIEKHIGTGKTEEEINALYESAREYINEQQGSQQPLQFKSPNKYNNLKIKKVVHHYAYEFLEKCYEKLRFNEIDTDLIKNLAIIRIIEPSSKIRATELLSKHFRINYTSNHLYRHFKEAVNFKDQYEALAIDYAKKNLDFDFNLIFYDVTTLYFEAFQEDALRKCGFSKDNKFNQPQILVALMVDKNGYPVGYDVFEGNKFEGHTILPVMLRFKKKYNVENFTVVADAAMLSKNNIKELKENKLKYLVGARLGNMPMPIIEEISRNISKDEKNIINMSVDEERLVCDYSIKRASKDKFEREKQIQRALKLINSPGKIAKKSRFLRAKDNAKGNDQYELNEDLIKKSRLLDGIKGYVTNIADLSDDLLIARYKDLWKIEKAFRIAKNDLKIRPTFLWKQEAIKAHLVIVFASLCIAKYLEHNSIYSIKIIVDMLLDVYDVELRDQNTKESFTKRSEIPQKLIDLERKLDLEVSVSLE